MTRNERRAELAEATRRVMDAAVRTDVDDEALAVALSALDDAARVLSSQLRAAAPLRTPEQFREGLSLFNPVIGAANPYAPPMTVEVVGEGEVEGTVTLGAIHEGPPGSVHGGIVATLLDQLLGHAIAAADAPGMTVELTVRYQKPTPFLVPLTLRGRHDRTDGRRVWASAEIVTPEGDVTASATGTFLQLTEKHRERMAALMEERAG